MENAGGEEKNFFAKKFFLLPLHPLIIFKKLLCNFALKNALLAPLQAEDGKKTF